MLSPTAAPLNGGRRRFHTPPAGAKRFAAELELDAKRALGELLKQQPKNSGGPERTSAVVTGDRTPTAPTLKELGITKDQSSQAQKLASIPTEDYEQPLPPGKQSGEHVNTRH